MIPALALALTLIAGTPLPEVVKVVPPSADVPPSVAVFSGTWTGKWNETLDHTLVVERIEGRTATLIYSWGDSSQGGRGGYSRVSGEIDEKGALRAILRSGADVTYRYSGDGRLFAEYYRDGRKSRAILKRN
jgi:hypothetical protein